MPKVVARRARRRPVPATLRYYDGDDSAAWRPGGSSGRKKSKKSRKSAAAALKSRVTRFAGDWDALEDMKYGYIKRGEKELVKKHVFIKVDGEDMRDPEDDGEAVTWDPSLLWIARIEEIKEDRARVSASPIWLLVRWLYCQQDILDEAKPTSREHLEKELSSFGSFERAWSSKTDIIPLESVLGIAEVVRYDDRAVATDLWDISQDTYYVRTDYDDLEQTLSSRFYTRRPSLCAINNCPSPRYCPDDTYSQVFCARFGCKLWYHADCVAGTTNPWWYPTRELHERGRMLALPLPTALSRSDAERFNADTTLHFLEPELRGVLLAVARQPIVRPTTSNVTGNMADVLRARQLVHEVRDTSTVGCDEIRKIKEWLRWRGFKAQAVEKDAREARARAAGVKRDSVRAAMEEYKEYELLVCPRCGHPM